MAQREKVHVTSDGIRTRVTIGGVEIPNLYRVAFEHRAGQSVGNLTLELVLPVADLEMDPKDTVFKAAGISYGTLDEQGDEGMPR